MLIKTLHRKLSHPGLFQLACYINQQKDSLENEPNFAIRYNTSKITMRGIAEDFRQNNALIPTRKNRNGIGHYLLSFHPKEKIHLNNEKLFVIAQEFCRQLEADKKIVFARPHFDKENYHVHFMVSASEFGSGKSTRISKDRLREIKMEMNLFQQKQFPELKHSLFLPHLKSPKKLAIGIPVPKKFKDSDGAIHIKKRGKTSKLDSIRQSLYDLAKKQTNKDSFLQALEKQGIQTYRYRNQIKGVMVDQKKYRFKRLGLDIENIKSFVRSYELGQLDLKQQKQQQKQLKTFER